MKKAKEKIKYWGQVLLLPIFGLSYLMPRNKKIWLFGSTFGRRFADNPRYFYLYIATHGELNIRPIWISKNRESIQLLTDNHYEAYYNHSLKGIWYCLRSRIYIYDNYPKDISHWLSGGATKINLWHGTGNKKANHDNKFDRYRNPKNLWERFITFPRRLSDEKPSHYVLATSEPLKHISSSVFNTSLEHVIVDGYPRNDAMLDSMFPNLLTPMERDNLLKIQQWKQEGKKIDFYMPTFRDSEVDFFKIMNLEKFNQFLKNNGIVFIVKLHPKSKLKTEFAAIHFSNIYSVNSEIDPYTFLGYVDILTSDYSSVYSDFMLLDRPVVAFHYDFEEYSKNTREGYVPFEDYMPECKATTMEELMLATLHVLKEDTYKEKRAISRNRMFLYQDANATKRLVLKVKQILEK